jgi:hypothetical protein
VQLPHPRRAEDKVQIRDPAQGPLALLLGHTAAEPDQDLRPIAFEQPELAQAGVDLVLGLLAHAAGVEQDEVGLFGDGCGEHPLLHQLSSQPLAVQLVHLATPGLDEETAGLQGSTPPPSGGSSITTGSTGSKV